MTTPTKYISFLVVLMIAFSCSDDDKPVDPLRVPEIMVSDDLDRLTFTTDIQGASSYQWSIANDDIPISDDNQPEAFVALPLTEGEQQVEISLTVKDKGDASEATRMVTIPNLTPARAYGLGRELESTVSNDQEYNWYLDQFNSGTHYKVNCGPTSVTMAIKWADENFSGTPLDARNTYRSGGGWWYTNDIINYLNDHDVSNYTISLLHFGDLKAEIDAGNIAILCLDMYYVRDQSADLSRFHLHKFYKTAAADWGHFIVVKGYSEVDGNLFFETYDPYSMNVKYTDGALKGENRYYISTDLDNATQVWWDYAIIISKDEGSGGRRKVNVDEIVHMPGR